MGYTILSTKKLNPSIVSQLEQDGICVIENEFISINFITSPAIADRLHKIDDNDTLVFTSANAVASVKDNIGRHLSFRVYCISGKTKHFVEASFPNAKIIDVAPYGNQLAEKIMASGVKKVIFCCGNIRRDELPSMLTESNIEVEELVVYETIETPGLINQHFDAVLFFSPSAVSSFFAANQLNPDVVCFSIGTTTEATLKSYTNNNLIITADDPTQEALAIGITKHFKNQVQL